MAAPIEITLYDDQDEAKKTYAVSIVRWGVLKKAARLSASMGQGEGSESLTNFDELSQFVVEVFHNQFTVAELEEGADLPEVITVLQAIISRATGLIKANPTPPPQSR